MIYIAVALFFSVLGFVLGLLIGFMLGDKYNEDDVPMSKGDGGWPTRTGNQVRR